MLGNIFMLPNQEPWTYIMVYVVGDGNWVVKYVIAEGFQIYHCGGWGCNLILLVTEGCMQNFKTLAQPLLGEFGWGRCSCSSCSCSCYHGKTKSTPRFGLGWEFDNNHLLFSIFLFVKLPPKAKPGSWLCFPAVTTRTRTRTTPPKFSQKGLC